MDFKSFRQSLEEGKADVVYNKKIKGLPVSIKKTPKNKFEVWIDGDKLDDYTSQKVAEKSAIEFIKHLKG
jgi:hypothetical protein